MMHLIPNDILPPLLTPLLDHFGSETSTLSTTSSNGILSASVYSEFSAACRQGDLRKVKLILDDVSGAFIDGINSKRRKNLLITHIENDLNSLGHAASRGHLSIIKHLIEEEDINPNGVAGIDMGPTNTKSILSCAASNGHMALVRYLVGECGVDLDKLGETSLYFTAQMNRSDRPIEQLTMIHYLIELCDIDHDQLRDRDTSALCTAATSNKLHIVKYLVEQYSAPVDSTNHDDDTPIVSACDRGHLLTVNYLIEVGNANIDQVSRTNHTLIQIATSKGHDAVAKYLELAKIRQQSEDQNSFSITSPIIRKRKHDEESHS